MAKKSDSGGLRTYVDEGATIITHESNKEFFDRALSAPRSLNPDRLARSGKKPLIETVAEKKVIADGTLEIHLIKDNPHSDGLLMVFLPKEKIVIEADAFTPGGAAANVKPALNLVENVEKLNSISTVSCRCMGPEWLRAPICMRPPGSRSRTWRKSWLEVRRLQAPMDREVNAGRLQRRRIRTIV